MDELSILMAKAAVLRQKIAFDPVDFSKPSTLAPVNFGTPIARPPAAPQRDERFRDQVRSWLAKRIARPVGDVMQNFHDIFVSKQR